MATSRQSPARRGAHRPEPTTDKPIRRILFDGADLSGVPPGGDGPTEFVPVDSAYRARMLESFAMAVTALTEEFSSSSHGVGTLVFKLRSNAIAKSHRPVQLVNEANLLPAGHERVEEMLVAAHSGSVSSFSHVVLDRDIRAIRANLSAIEAIEPWGAARRLPEGIQSLREQGRALVRLFRYANASATSQVEQAVLDTLRQWGLNPVKFDGDAFGWSIFRLKGLRDLPIDLLARLSSLAGIRRIRPEPRANPLGPGLHGSRGDSGWVPTPIGIPAPNLPTVGVFDTGVSGGANQLGPWIRSQDLYVLPPDTDYQHGTHVASLVAGARTLNGNHPELPPYGAFVHDVCGLEVGSAHVGDLIERLKDAIPKAPEVKVWNLSLGVPSPCDEQTFSEFAMALDQLSDQYGVLFVVAAGNYVDVPRRTWPPSSGLTDRIGSPAEATRVLTVGSMCHAAGPFSLNAAGEPAAYSRRGPGPVFTPKPDIVHAGGNVHAPWNPGASSLAVVTANNTIGLSFGTSFAAPVAASMAAHVWQALEGQSQPPNPALVKALMIHAAQLSSPAYSPEERRYFGAGLPLDVMDCLFDSPDSFTLLFEAHLVPGMKWRKAPYPIPAALMRDGKLRAEVIMTCAYAPPLDSSAGAEYVRANVELSFGVLKDNKISSKVPMVGEDYTDGYEAAQVEHGGKWAPVKVHRKAFPSGVGGDSWALQARPYLRAFEPALTQPIRTYILCTLRSLDGDLTVHEDGVRALASCSWANVPLPLRIPVRSS